MLTFTDNFNINAMVAREQSEPLSEHRSSNILPYKLLIYVKTVQYTVSANGLVNSHIDVHTKSTAIK